jgi:hypothetical protein
MFVISILHAIVIWNVITFLVLAIKLNMDILVVVAIISAINNLVSVMVFSMEGAVFVIR